MFGFVMANMGELEQPRKARYTAAYCGICRGMREEGSNLARLGLSYDMAFLALLLMSLYEPEESAGTRACGLHPIRPRPWVDNACVRYASDMNVVLAYYQALDDVRDEGSLRGKLAAKTLGKSVEVLAEKYPRQCKAIASCLEQLAALERENCDNPDLPAGVFGELMGELLVWQEDLWQENLRQMGQALGRFIYLADAAVDYRRDKKKKQYNPFLAMGMADPARWEEYLVLAMGRCTDYYERLPLVQDKDILDNILYSGVWVEYRRRMTGKTREETNDR